MENTREPAIRLSNIWMAFSGVYVLKNINFEIYPGEIHALIGENGAGKSTLARIIGGIHRPKQGEIFVGEKHIEFSNPQQAVQHQIALIHQEPQVFPDLTVAESVFVNRMPKNRVTGLVDWKKIYRESAELFASLNQNFNLKSKVGKLSIADRQMVDIANALSQGARVLIMDETTASLTPSEVESLFKIITDLKKKGAGIVFIGHRLEEVCSISDTVTILRDGEIVASRISPDTKMQEIIGYMVGREVKNFFTKTKHVPGKTLLEVKGLTGKDRFNNISFVVREKEIVCLAGLVGSGRTEVAESIFGIHPYDSGCIIFGEKEVKVKNPQDAIKNEVYYLPEDRQGHGLLMTWSILNNLSLSVIELLSRFGFIFKKKEHTLADEYIKKMKIMYRNVTQPVRFLSGGNQQKIVISKCLSTKPRVMILDEPTRGIDVGIKAEVHKIMNDLCETGVGILMISSDLPEVIAMSDRVVVMREGSVTGEFQGGEITPENIMYAATGQKKENLPC